MPENEHEKNMTKIKSSTFCLQCFKQPSWGGGVVGVIRHYDLVWTELMKALVPVIPNGQRQYGDK